MGTVGIVGIVENCMVTTFPVLQFFFGIVGRLGAARRNPPVNFKDTALLKSLCVASAPGRPDPTTLILGSLLSWAVSQNGPIVGQDPYRLFVDYLPPILLILEAQKLC
jgi:hypothetical protein